MPGRAEPVARDGVALLAELGLAQARAVELDDRRRRATSRQKRASVSDSSPRSLWFTCTAETR